MKLKLTLFGLSAATLGLLLGRFLGSGAAETSVSPTAQGKEKEPSGAPTVVVSTPATQVNQMPNSLEKRQRILTLIDGAEKAEDFIKLLEEFSGDEFTESALVERWAQRDPAGCLSWVKGRPPSAQDFHLKRALFRSWSQHSPDAAFAASLETQLLPGFASTPYEVIDAVLKRDFKLGGALMAKMPDVPNFFQLPEDLWKVDPAGMLKAVVPTNRPMNSFFAAALVEPLKAWSTKDPEAVQAWLSSLPPEVAGPLLPSAMAGLASKDPVKASELIAKMPSAATREAAAAELAKGWVKQNPLAAFNYAGEQLGTSRAATLNLMAKGLLPLGPQAIAQLFAQLPPGRLRSEAIPAVAMEWLDQEPSAASQWLTSLPAAEDRNEAFKSISVRWAENAPDLAMKYLQSNPDPELNDVYLKVVARHAGDNPASAVQYVLQMPADQQMSGIRAAYNMMSNEYQVEAAAEILGTLPTLELQSEAVKTFMEPFGTGLRLFDEGLKWAAALPPGALRDTARDTLLQSTLITEGERKKVLEQLK